mgnify:CR=1 FL=1
MMNNVGANPQLDILEIDVADHTKDIQRLKFDIANTAQNMDRVRKVKSDMINGVYAAINIADPDSPMAFQTMVFSKETEAKWSADGVIQTEWEGQFVR